MCGDEVRAGPRLRPSKRDHIEERPNLRENVIHGPRWATSPEGMHAPIPITLPQGGSVSLRAWRRRQLIVNHVCCQGLPGAENISAISSQPETSQRSFSAREGKGNVALSEEESKPHAFMGRTDDLSQTRPTSLKQGHHALRSHSLRRPRGPD
ncbi:unnamed protein product [Boreogadus saida]